MFVCLLKNWKDNDINIEKGKEMQRLLIAS